MLVQAIIIAASAAVASAQVVYNSTTNQFICPASAPNGAFCSSDSLTSNIIIRCNNGIGQPGNCNDNLSGYPPVGVNYAPCWQTSATSGDAACSKNCVVQCGSGACGNGTITLPNCTPTYTASSSSTKVSTSSTTTSTGTTTITSKGTTITQTFTTTYCPSTTLSTAKSTGTGGVIPPPNNGTVTGGGNPTKTPVGPTSAGSTPPAFTGAANAYHPAVGGTLAGVGLIVAYFL